MKFKTFATWLIIIIVGLLIGLILGVHDNKYINHQQVIDVKNNILNEIRYTFDSISTKK